MKVINLSLGGYGYYDCSVFADVAAQGITVVAASGNEAEEQPGQFSYPASCANVISVGSSNSLDQRSYYSQYNSSVDISAPGGQGNLDTDADGYADLVYAYSNDTDIVGNQGTSMASPTAAGGLALLYAIDASMTPAKINSLLENGSLTEDLGATGKDSSFGYGRLNLAKAIQSVSEDTGEATESSYFYTEPPTIDFGNITTQINIELKKVGTGAISVSNLTADDATGLSYSSNVDSEGIGTYTLYIDRGDIPDGEFQNRIYFNISDDTKVSVGTFYQVGADRTRPDLGKAYVGIKNSDDEWVATGELNFDGSLSFVANDIIDGSYYFIISTDFDDDNYVCDLGELCAYFPEFGSQPKYFEVSGSDISGAEIYINPLIKYGGINAASTGENNTKASDRGLLKGDSRLSIFKLDNDAIDNSNGKISSKIPRDAIPLIQN